jgi:transcriptional regulator with XRE-family HTH domain
MSTTRDLVTAIKIELKASGLTYAELAREIGMAESSVKRMLARGDMTLARLDQVLRVLKLDVVELARQVADARPPRIELTLRQEAAVVSEPKLLLMAICCLSQWTVEQVLETYQLTHAEAVRLLTRLDRLGIIELRPMNRYRLRVDKGMRWQPNGPVMRFFRESVAPEYFAGGFDGEDALLTLVHGRISRERAREFSERLQRVAQDFAQQHLADQRLAAERKDGYVLVLGMRPWLFSAFEALLRTRSRASGPRNPGV